MQTSNRLLDDLAKVASGAASTLAGIKDEINGLIRQQLERLLADLDLVSREEFDAQAEILARTRARVIALETELEALAREIEELTGRA